MIPYLSNQPWKDERQSWPGWLPYSGRFTHISGHPSAAGRAQDREKFAGQRPTFYHFATQPTIICHLTLVMFLRYLTLYKNWNATLTSESIDTWDRIPQGIIDKATDQWQTRLRACVKAKWRHFEHLLWSRHTTGSFQGKTAQFELPQKPMKLDKTDWN